MSSVPGWLYIAQWLTDELYTTSEIEVTSLDQRIFEEDMVDSLALASLIESIHERWGLDFSMRDIDRELWATPTLIAVDIHDELARTG